MRGRTDKKDRTSACCPFSKTTVYSRAKPITKNYASVFLLVARNVIVNVTTNGERNLIVHQFNWTSIMKWKFLDSKNLAISRLGVLIPVPPSSILLKREAKECDIINFHVSVVILFAWSAVRSVLHADKRRQWSNFCTDDKPLFVITASLILCVQRICPARFLPLLILSLWVSVVCSTYFNGRIRLQEK